MTSRADRRQARKEAVIHAISIRVQPSFRDVAAMCDLPLSTVYELCETLQDEGEVAFTKGIARSLRRTGK
jgi:DNA-binding IclR family transcriptional regulator